MGHKPNAFVQQFSETRVIHVYKTEQVLQIFTLTNMVNQHRLTKLNAELTRATSGSVKSDSILPINILRLKNSFRIGARRLKCFGAHCRNVSICAGIIWQTSQPATAAEARDDQAQSDPMKELIVTADSLKTTVDQTHYSLSVFQDDDLRRQTDRDLNDLLARIPNIEIDPLEGLIIRGLATLGSGGDQQTQLYLIDGAWTPGIFHKWDLDQLEVLRGSQSTIGSATGGTLGLKYKEPEFESSGNIMVSFEGDANDRDAGIAFGGPLIKNQLSYRLAAYTRVSDGLVENQFNGSKSWQSLSEEFARGKLNWYPQGFDGDEYALEFYYLSQNTDGSGWINQGSLPEDAFNRKTAIERDLYDNVKISDLRFRYKRQVNPRTTLKLVASVNLKETQSLQDRNNQPQDDGFNEKANNNKNYAFSGNILHDTDKWQWSASFYSFYFDTQNTTDIVISLDYLSAVPANWRVRYILNNKKWWINGGRLTGQYFGSNWYLSAAVSMEDDRADTLRGTEHRRISSSGNSAVDAAYDSLIALQPALEKEGQYRFGRANPTFAFGYHLSPTTTLGIKLEQASRRGWDRINTFRAQIYSYDPETARDLDLFLRTSLFEGRMQLNANLFTGYIKDQQIEYCFSSSAFDCHIVNAVRTDRKGVELDSWLFIDNIKTWIAASFLDSKFEKFTPPELLDQGVLVTNPEVEIFLKSLESVEVPSSPSWKFAAGIIYEKGSFYSSLDLTIRPGTLGSVILADVSNDKRALLNGRVGWRFRNGLELSLWGRNLADEAYLTYFSPEEPGAYVGDPRQVGLTIQYDWGK